MYRFKNSFLSHEFGFENCEVFSRSNFIYTMTLYEWICKKFSIFFRIFWFYSIFFLNKDIGSLFETRSKKEI